MKKAQKTVQTNRKEITYTHIQVGGNKICFMFAGLGYHYEKPIFYYLTMLMVESKIDVVHIHYSYPKDFLQKDIQAITEEMLHDVTPVVSEVLKNHNYQNILFVGKSLGTIPIVNGFMPSNQFQDAMMILLTPLLKLAEITDSIAISKHKGLLVIGDKDPHYNKEYLKQLVRTNLHTFIMKDVDHSLDNVTNDSLASIQSITILIENLKKLMGSL